MRIWCSSSAATSKVCPPLEGRKCGAVIVEILAHYLDYIFGRHVRATRHDITVNDDLRATAWELAALVHKIHGTLAYRIDRAFLHHIFAAMAHEQSTPSE